MKKISRIFPALCLALGLSAALASCAHKCEFSTEWSKDATSHWHPCINEECTEIADKADHTWDDGQITTQATQEIDGVKTFTCTACSATKTEPVAFTGMTEAEWNAAFASSVFENFAYTEVATTSMTGMNIDAETSYKFTKDAAWAKMTMAGQSDESYAPDSESADAVRDMLVESIREMTPFSGYKYDAATKTYKATRDIKIDSLEAFTRDVSLTFADGKLVEIKYTISFTQEGIDITATSTVSLSDYGTVVLNPTK